MSILLRCCLFVSGLALLGLSSLLLIVRQQTPNSAWIAFSSSMRGDADIYIMYPDGSELTRVVDSGGEDYSPSWMQNELRIMFTARQYNIETLYRVRPNGSGLERLPDSAAAGRLRANLSPDGKWIALVSFRSGNWDIYRVQPNGGEMQQLTTHLGQDGFPSWSADGKWIAFASEDQNGWEIYRMRSDGTDQQRLTGAAGDSWQPAWSPPVNLDWRGWHVAGIGILLVGLGIIMGKIWARRELQALS